MKEIIEDEQDDEKIINDIDFLNQEIEKAKQNDEIRAENDDHKVHRLEEADERDLDKSYMFAHGQPEVHDSIKQLLISGKDQIKLWNTNHQAETKATEENQDYNDGIDPSFWVALEKYWNTGKIRNLIN